MFMGPASEVHSLAGAVIRFFRTTGPVVVYVLIGVHNEDSPSQSKVSGYILELQKRGQIYLPQVADAAVGIVDGGGDAAGVLGEAAYGPQRDPLHDADILWADYVFLTGMIIHRPVVDQIIARCQELGVRPVAGGPTVHGCRRTTPRWTIWSSTRPS